MHLMTQDPLAMAERMTAHACMPAIDMRAELARPEAMADKIARMQVEVAKLPQIDNLVTDHFFVPGMYCRRLARKAGTVIVGKVHRAPHFFTVMQGELLVLHEGGVKTLRAGDVIECAPGTKRVTFALTDVTAMTIHKTDKTDLAEIEAELIEPDETALFDASNSIKALLGEIK